MQLSHQDYTDLAASGPKGLNGKQQSQIIEAVQSIKARAYSEGSLAASARNQWYTDTHVNNGAKS